jgi:hypothetical protein
MEKGRWCGRLRAFLSWTLDGGKWSLSRLGHLTAGEGELGTRLIGGMVRPIASLDDLFYMLGTEQLHKWLCYWGCFISVSRRLVFLELATSWTGTGFWNLDAVNVLVKASWPRLAGMQLHIMKTLWIDSGQAVNDLQELNKETSNTPEINGL